MKKFVIRDLSLTVIVTFTFLLDNGHIAVQTIMGLGIGLLIYLMHEWSHYLAGLATGAALSRAKAIYSPFLFSFDSRTHSRKQFIDMSWPGFVTTFGSLAILFFFRPAALWSDIAWLAAVVLSLFTLIIEGPIFLWAILIGEIPAVEIPGLGNNSIFKKLRDWPAQFFR